MKIITTLHRIYIIDSIDAHIPFYEHLLGQKVQRRFTYEAYDLELARIGNFLLIAGKDENLKAFRSTNGTIQVDSIEEFRTFLSQNNCSIIRDIAEVPTGKNMTVRHPDGSIFEYVELATKERQ